MTARILFPAIIALLAVAFGWIAYGFPSMSLNEGFGPGLFPLVLGAIVGILAGIEVIIQICNRRRSNNEPVPDPDPESHVSITFREAGATCLLVALIVAAVFAVRHVGFVPAASSLVFALSLAMGMRPIWITALASIAVALSANFIFSEMFGLVLAF